MQDRHGHILNASTNLLSVCFFLITGLKLTKTTGTWGDEIAWFAALLFLTSVLFSYLTLRTRRDSRWLDIWADRCFLAGTFALFASVATIALTIY
jgi:hypothetical protein